MIKLSNGKVLDFLAASGALAYDGRGWLWEYPFRWLGLIEPRLFTIVVKSLTRKPRKGNLRWYKPWSCIRLISGGVINAVGLTNPGIEWWISSCYPKIQEISLDVIVSIYPETVEECLEMISMLNSLDIVAVEINASCPQHRR